MSYKVFIIGKRPVTAQNEIPVVISDQTVSRQHARLTYDNGNFFLEDLNSLNKTYVNNLEVMQRTPVTTRDVITLGRKITFSLNHPIIMENIGTPEPGIRPITRFDYATWGSRLGGYILDYIFFSLLTVPLYAIYYGVMDWIRGSEDETSLAVIALILLVTAIVLGFHFYFAVAINNTGYTWGKRIAKVKVIDAETKRYPSKGQVWGRYLAYTISALIAMIGFFMPLWTEKKQALHDMMANTLVIKANS